MALVDWFERGCADYAAGKPSSKITDARISSRARQEWYCGWHHQQYLNAPPMDASDRAEIVATIGQILADLNELSPSVPH